MSDFIFKAQGVKKSFGANLVLNGIDLSVRRGDVIAIIGPSGGGKTTLLRCLNFLEKADEGILNFDGMELKMNSANKKSVRRFRQKTGFVFQNYNLFQNKNALANITLALTVARKMKKDAAAEIGKILLERVGLSEKIKNYPHELSGGQQQRLAIARALACNPEIIFFDEPTSALDPELTGEVLEVMRSLAEEGMTMIIVTHEMSFAKNISTQTIFMENGQIVENGATKEFFSLPQKSRTKEFLNSILNR